MQATQPERSGHGLGEKTTTSVPDLAGPAGSDGLSAVLDQLAESAETTSAEHRMIAASARALSEEHRAGRSWAAILAGGGQPALLVLLGSSLQRLSQTSSRVRTAVAAALMEEGLSTREIAAHLGVTHQRVSAMLNRPGT
jgi:DNA-binding transcriptional regulator LsrR (DeoR family)